MRDRLGWRLWGGKGRGREDSVHKSLEEIPRYDSSTDEIWKACSRGLLRDGGRIKENEREREREREREIGNWKLGKSIKHRVSAT